MIGHYAFAIRYAEGLGKRTDVDLRFFEAERFFRLPI
jgi:hypothetical protein